MWASQPSWLRRAPSRRSSARGGREHRCAEAVIDRSPPDWRRRVTDASE
ncbi:hypothetical protein BTZ20_2404 [Rhodococcus sp. MTM3W5.2]|nr:hypothetical protein BTZ20_2404 [Rhodococcus sp. MTM3W5.2]